MSYNLLPTTNAISRTPSEINDITLYKLVKHSNVVFSFMSIFTSVYLLSQTLQVSGLILSIDHNKVTQNSYAYNLLFVWMATYSLFHYSNIETNKKPNIYLYWFFCIIGAYGFAMLGELPFLKNVVITKDWWKKLPPDAWIVVGGFLFIILYCAIKECKQSMKDKRCCINISKLLFVIGIYGFILGLLATAGATKISYHVHHAIFAGILSLWFLDWDSKLTMIMHAILMGVVIEGIDFYSIQEFFLFIVGDKSISFLPVLVISLIFTLMAVLFSKFFYYNN